MWCTGRDEVILFAVLNCKHTACTSCKPVMAMTCGCCKPPINPGTGQGQPVDTHLRPSAALPVSAPATAAEVSAGVHTQNRVTWAVDNAAQGTPWIRGRVLHRKLLCTAIGSEARCELWTSAAAAAAARTMPYPPDAAAAPARSVLGAGAVSGAASASPSASTSRSTSMAGCLLPLLLGVLWASLASFDSFFFVLLSAAVQHE